MKLRDNYREKDFPAFSDKLINLAEKRMKIEVTSRTVEMQSRRQKIKMLDDWIRYSIFIVVAVMIVLVLPILLISAFFQWILMDPNGS